MDYAALIGMVVQLAGGVAGMALSKMDRATALDILQKSYDQSGNLDVPQLQKLITHQIGPSAYNQIKEDPEFRSQQAASDKGLQDVIDQGGLTLADKAALNAVRNKIATTESAGRNSITADMARRGTLDSGAQMAMQAANAQAAEGQANQAGEYTAGQAQARALQALQQKWSNANTAGNQDYNRQAQRAGANDAISRANAEALNSTDRYNSTLPGQQFGMNLQRQQLQNSTSANLANVYGANADRTQDTAAGIGKGAGQGIAAYGQDMSDKDAAAAWRRYRGLQGNSDNTVSSV